MKRFITMIRVFFSFILLLLAGHSAASNLFDYPVIDLSNDESQFLTPQQDVNVVLFFEPNCSWCFKQTRVFNQYLKDCDADIQFFGIGVNGNRREIKKEIWRQRADFPMVMASRPMLTAIGEVSSTPLTLLLDKKGNIFAHVRGYLPEDQWYSFLSDKTDLPSSCTGVSED